MRVVRALVALTAGAMIATMPVAAHAKTYTQTDFTTDVDQTPRPLGSGPTTPAPDQTDGDIVSTTVSHRQHVVRIRMNFRDLARSGRHIYHLAIKSDRRWRLVDLVAKPGRWQGKVVTTNFRHHRVRCAMRHAIDYDANRVIFKTRRSCLGRPHWVQVADSVAVFATDVVYLDEGGTGPTEEVVYGPRIPRGPGPLVRVTRRG